MKDKHANKRRRASLVYLFVFKQKTAYELRISDWSSDVCSSDLCLNHYEAVGQPIEAHAKWLRDNDYLPKKATIVLPHDGATNDKVRAVSYEISFKDMGYDVVVIPNMGKGAAMQRDEAVRRVMASLSFHEKKTEAGREALGFYNEKWYEKRHIG